MVLKEKEGGVERAFSAPQNDSLMLVLEKPA